MMRMTLRAAARVSIVAIGMASTTYVALGALSACLPPQQGASGPGAGPAVVTIGECHVAVVLGAVPAAAPAATIDGGVAPAPGPDAAPTPAPSAEDAQGYLDRVVHPAFERNAEA